MDKKIDIIILTLNNEDNVRRFLYAIEMQSVRPDKIIIMNTLKDEKDRSTIVDIENDHHGLHIDKKIVYKKDFFHGKTRNDGAKCSDADYIIYMTDDAIPYDEHLIETLYKGMVDNKDKKVAMSYARHIAYKGATFTENKTREFNYPDKSVIKDIDTEKIYGIKNYFASNVCCIYDKKIFDSLGGFEDNVSFNEDELYAYKVIKNGYRVYYNASAKVYHSHNYTLKEQYKRNVLVGLSQKTHSDIFGHISSENEGIKLVKYMTIECLKRLKFITLIKFYIECIYRYKGYMDGKKSV